MDMEKEGIWKERRDYVDALIYIKHNTISKNSYHQLQDQLKNNYQAEPQYIGVRGSVKLAVKRRLQNEKIRKNPIVKLLIKIKRALGIKFY